MKKKLSFINPNAAGIDIGSFSHFVAIPEGRDKEIVKEFKSYTSDLNNLAIWLKKCKIDTVAMESTGVYWIPLYELLEKKGFKVLLVNARHIKNVPGRKTDVLDCQWIQQLHSYGLLQAAFRPNKIIAKLRSYIRQRSMLIEYSSSHIQHMQKALSLMNIQLHNVINDLTGSTGLAIIRDIIAGERDPVKLSKHRHSRCKNSKEIIRKSLEGHYQEEHVFALKQALELYDYYNSKIEECNSQIKELVNSMESQTDQDLKKAKNNNRKHNYNFDVQSELERVIGVNIIEIPGINDALALKIISEIGIDMTLWKSAKHFASWLGLCPGNKISGGKRLSGKTKPSANKAAQSLRMAAYTLFNSKSYLGAYLRRLRARLGSPKAITATAHKLAVILYAMIKNKKPFKDMGAEYYEKKYRDKMIKNLKRKAMDLGFAIIENQAKTAIT